MPQLNDRKYFADRIDQENESGDRSATPAIAAIHYELAYRYGLLSSGVVTNVIPLVRRCAQRAGRAPFDALRSRENFGRHEAT